MTPATKRCAKCEAVTPLASFGKQAARPDGLHPWCKPCVRDYGREYYKREDVRERRRSWRKENEEYDREKRAGYLYGVSPDHLIASQAGRCAICGTGTPGGRWGTWHIDHDHRCCSTQKTCGQCVRGALCSACNTGLGKFKDSADVLRSALRYLERR